MLFRQGPSSYFANCAVVLDVADQTTDDGANVQQYGYWGGDNQRWNVENVRDSVYRIEAVHSGKVLDVEGALTDDGANVNQWVDRSEDQQRWRFVSV